MSEVKRYGHISYLVEATPEMVQLYPQMTIYVLSNDFDAQRLRADTAEAELEDVIDELRVTVEDRDNAKRNSSAFEERMGDLQVANGKLQDKLAVAEQRIAEAKAILEIIYDDPEMLCAVTMEVARRTREFLNPNPEAESHDHD